MKTIRILTLILLGIIAATLIWAATLPSSYIVKETIEIEAPIEKVFSQVNNLRNWTYWSPWPDSIYHTKYVGNSEGIGAKMLWTDDKEGRGEQTILESINNSKVITELFFTEQGNSAKTEFQFFDTPAGTEVNWIMKGEDLSYPFGRFVGLVIKKGASHNFAIGLKQLKEYTESVKDQPDYLGYKIYDEVKEEQHFIAFIDSGNMDELKSKFRNNFDKINNKFKEIEKTPVGPAIAEWRAYNPEGSSTFACLLPLGGKLDISGNGLSYYNFPKRRVIWLTHSGSYSTSYKAWNTMDKYIKYNNLQKNGSPYEIYITGPMNEADTSLWVTNICFPVMD
ncbi:MAG: SRPBCC family protein [Bacteroidales bacterium]|nr:SRPBCC family protein [Bacteroidales bacterium]